MVEMSLEHSKELKHKLAGVPCARFPLHHFDTPGTTQGMKTTAWASSFSEALQSNPPRLVPVKNQYTRRLTEKSGLLCNKFPSHPLSAETPCINRHRLSAEEEEKKQPGALLLRSTCIPYIGQTYRQSKTSFTIRVS